MGTGVIIQKDDSVRQHSRAFWVHGASQQPQPPRKEPHLFFTCLHFQCWTNTLYTTLIFRTIKKQLCGLRLYNRGMLVRHSGSVSRESQWSNSRFSLLSLLLHMGVRGSILIYLFVTYVCFILIMLCYSTPECSNSSAKGYCLLD